MTRLLSGSAIANPKTDSAQFRRMLCSETSRREGEPVDRLQSAQAGAAARRRWLVAAVAGALLALLVPSAGDAAPDAPAAARAMAPPPLPAAGSPSEAAPLQAPVPPPAPPRPRPPAPLH